MTTADQLTIEERAPRKPREAKRGGLFVNDAELIERLGVPEKEAREALRMLDADRSKRFPPKQKLWGDRRYWPAVEQWLGTNCGLRMDVPRRDHHHD